MSDINPASSSRLFTDPSFFKGVARNFDLFGLLDEYNYSKGEKAADTLALKRDWFMVGRDIINAFMSYGRTAKR